MGLDLSVPGLLMLSSDYPLHCCPAKQQDLKAIKMFGRIWLWASLDLAEICLTQFLLSTLLLTTACSKDHC